MNILIFNWRDIEHPWAGGSELNIHEMAKRLVMWGHNITMICAHHYGNSFSHEKRYLDGIKIIRLGGRFSLYFIAPLYYIFCLRKQYDMILDIENGIPFFTPLFVRKPICCLVNHIHKDVFFIEMPFPLNSIGYIMETKIMPFIYKNIYFVAISKTTKNSLMSLGIREDKIFTVYAGLDHQEYKPGGKKFTKPTLVYVGRLRKYKRVGLLIDVVVKLLSNQENIQLYIIGDGDDTAMLSKKIALLDKKNIHLKGFISQKEKIMFLQRSWIFVTPSLVEGWGLSVIEANSCGTPAIAFRVPGLSDAIRDNETGILVSNIDQMAEAISLLITNSVLRKRISLQAVAYADKFSWEKSSQKLLKCIEFVYGQTRHI